MIRCQFRSVGRPPTWSLPDEPDPAVALPESTVRTVVVGTDGGRQSSIIPLPWGLLRVRRRTGDWERYDVSKGRRELDAWLGGVEEGTRERSLRLILAVPVGASFTGRQDCSANYGGAGDFRCYMPPVIGQLNPPCGCSQSNFSEHMKSRPPHFFPWNEICLFVRCILWTTT
jgi:hypothetical protein